MRCEVGREFGRRRGRQGVKDNWRKREKGVILEGSKGRSEGDRKRRRQINSGKRNKPDPLELRLSN